MTQETKATANIFEFKHTGGDVFTYSNDTHEYTLNGVVLPGTTTPLELVNELSWDDDGKMTSKSRIIQQWAINKVADEILDKTKVGSYTIKELEPIVKEAKSAPNKNFKSAGISGTQIHDLIEKEIKNAIVNTSGYMKKDWADQYEQQVKNFILWACDNKVKFLFTEEPIYSKEWMNCGTVDFICEIDGKVLVGDIKTNGDKRRFKWNGKGYDFSKPVSDIHTIALFQAGAYAKMCTEEGARKLVTKVDGVVIVNIKKSGVFDAKLDVRYDYNLDSLVSAYDHVINLYKIFRNK